MAFNKAKNGKLTKEELTDKRLHALFDRADANKDGIVTRGELEVLYQKEKLEGGGFGGGPGGPGGDKGKDKKGFKGKGGPPQPGVVLPGIHPGHPQADRLPAQRCRRPAKGSRCQARQDSHRRAEIAVEGNERGQRARPPGRRKKKGPPPEDK